MADKNPRKALYYVLWSIIGILVSVIGVQHRNIASIEENCQSREDTIRANAERKAVASTERFIALLQNQLDQEKAARKADNQANQEQILELTGKVDAVFRKSLRNDSKNRKIEKGVESLSTETQKIEEVIQK